jgi:hypothetical protein
MDTKFSAGMTAHMVMLMILVEYAKNTHPDFEQYAIREIDTYLGKKLTEDSTVSEGAHEFRTIFMQILSSKREREPKRSLRRRFLNWLQRG